MRVFSNTLILFRENAYNTNVITLYIISHLNADVNVFEKTFLSILGKRVDI